MIPKNQMGRADMPMAKWALGAGIVLGLAALLYVVFRAVPNTVGGGDLSRFKIGALSNLTLMPNPPAQPIAQFSGPSDQPVSLASFRGKVVLVNLWATWCAPCVAEMPKLGELQIKIGDPDFEVIPVSIDREDAREEARKKLRELTNARLNFYHDPQMAIVFGLRTRGIPTSILYDRNGRERARLAGDADWNSPEAVALVQSVLAQKAD